MEIVEMIMLETKKKLTKIMTRLAVVTAAQLLSSWKRKYLVSWLGSQQSKFAKVSFTKSSVCSNYFVLEAIANALCGAPIPMLPHNPNRNWNREYRLLLEQQKNINIVSNNSSFMKQQQQQQTAIDLLRNNAKTTTIISARFR